jgi:hypothetical protein
MMRFLANARRWLRYYVLLFIEGDHAWGTLRFIGAVFAIGAFVLIGRLLEYVPPSPLVERYLAPLGLSPALNDFAHLLASFFAPTVLRHALAPLFGFLLALWMGARYVRDLLELPHLGQAFDHLLFTLFGGGYPKMQVADGKASVSDAERNPMLKIGGPGYVEIKLGSAAIFERVVGPTAVRGAGEHFLRRFEILREAYDLRELERTKAAVPVQTRDGVPLVLDEVRVRFRLRTRGARSTADPYPVLASAIRQATYSRRVSEKGLESWPEMVLGLAVGTITGWLSRRRMDELIPPPAPSTGDLIEEPLESRYRQSIHDLFLQTGTRQKFADIGAEVVWVAVGHLRPDPDIDPDLLSPDDSKGRDRIHEQMIETWASRYQALWREEMADVKGYAEWLNEMARAQVQVELIQTLTDGLRDAQAAGVPIADLFAARTADFVAALGEPNNGARLQLPEPSAPTDRLGALLKKLSETAGQPPEKKPES